jgi:ATP-binding cassette subfamily B protein
MNELRALLPYLRPYRRTYATGLLLVVVSNVFTTLGPRFLERGIDALRAGAPFSQVQLAVASLVTVALLGGVARFGMRQLLNSGSRRVETDLRDQLYMHLQRMSAEFYDRYPTGDVMARTTNDLLAVRMVAGPPHVPHGYYHPGVLIAPRWSPSAPASPCSLCSRCWGSPSSW